MPILHGQVITPPHSSFPLFAQKWTTLSGRMLSETPQNPSAQDKYKNTYPSQLRIICCDINLAKGGKKDTRP